jgi:hypothetical protein
MIKIRSKPEDIKTEKPRPKRINAFTGIILTVVLGATLWVLIAVAVRWLL